MNDNLIAMTSIDILIETPAGSREKFNYHPDTGFFKFKKALPYGMCFPFDFGCIPSTLGGDGDALDVMIISEFKTFTGCMIGCRIIGCLKAEQTENGKAPFRNDRFFAIPVASVQFKFIKTIADLPAKLLEDIKAFFVQYNLLENKNFTILGTMDPEKSLEAIENGKRAYAEQHS